MTTIPGKWGRIGLILGTSLLIVALPALPAQLVPISFNDYHGYTGSVDYLKRVAASHANITELIEIGKSNKDRPIYVLVVSNMKNGTTIDKQVKLRNERNEPNTQNVIPMKPYQGKPAIWIDGGMHGNEFTGTEVCLYTIDNLVSGYGSNPEITNLVDENTFYVCPVVNPDGVFNSVEAGIPQLQNSPAPDEGAGGQSAVPRDVNGDGIITQFRYKDPRGRYVMYEADPRVMIPFVPGESTSKDRYSVVWEGQGQPMEGQRAESALPSGSIDINSNFPEGWWKEDGFQGGSGYYPSSSPEAHALLEFFTNHTNILMVQSFHTSGGYTNRPFARWPDSRIDAKDLGVFDRILGKKYLELIGEEIPEAWKTEDTRSNAGAPAGQGRGGARPASTERPARGPLGWRHLYNEDQRTPTGYGLFIDWAYGQFGAYAVSPELWNWRKDTKGLPGYSGENDRGLWESTYIKYQETSLGGKAFLAWKPFNHPGSGQGEIGGWVAKYSPENAIPGPSLAGVCETHYQFALYQAKLMPRLEISDAKATVLYTTDNATDAKVEQQGDTFTVKKGKSVGKYQVVQVTASVKNSGELATQIARGAQLRGNREDAIWLIGDPAKVRFLEGTVWTRIGVLDGTMRIPAVAAPAAAAEAPAGRGGRGGGAGAPGAPPQGRGGRGGAVSDQQVRGTGNSREITWLVAVEGDTPLKIVLTSEKGGTKIKELSFK
jgi:hypothetical protein